MRTGEDYHIRVLVPCYKESLQILQVRGSASPMYPEACKNRRQYCFDTGIGAICCLTLCSRLCFLIPVVSIHTAAHA